MSDALDHVLSDLPLSDEERSSFEPSESGLFGDRLAAGAGVHDEEGGLLFRSLLERPEVLRDVWRASTRR